MLVTGVLTVGHHVALPGQRDTDFVPAACKLVVQIAGWPRAGLHGLVTTVPAVAVTITNPEPWKKLFHFWPH